MEQKESNAINATNDTYKDGNNAIVVVNGGGGGSKKKMMKIKDQQETPPNKPMKKRGAMHFFRVALYVLRRKSNKKSMHVDLASKVLVLSMRPLNLQPSDDDDDNNSNQPRLEPASKDIKEAPPAPPLIEETTLTEEEVFTPPLSPMMASSKSIASSSSTESLSQYASALNLRDLDTCEKGEEEEHGGDEMIDAKADEFINRFYEQMRIQNFEYMNSRNAGK